MRRYKLNAILALFLIAVMIATLVSCGGNKSSLVGKWVVENEDLITLSNGVPDSFELFKDGKGKTSKDMEMSWKEENNRLTFTQFFGDITFDYELKDSTLILTGNDGVEVSYKKE